MAKHLFPSQEENPATAFRTSKVMAGQIADLMELWNENKSGVIKRCLERIWYAEVGSKQPQAATQVAE